MDLMEFNLEELKDIYFMAEVAEMELTLDEKKKALIKKIKEYLEECE